MLTRAGFRDAVPTARVATTPRRHLLEAGRHIDWAFVRGSSEADGGKVLTSVKASDHYPIAFELRLSAAEQKVTTSGFLSLF
jgi:endonuclease/exonuclease/phosphatase family metal-dependent hydrolase